jgi:thymidylate synthase
LQTELNQLEKICIELAKKPGYSNLSFVILRPADLHDQFRPGYVPCAIAGDFKFRNGRLDLSVMFRTSDAFAVGYADIYYLRLLQEKILTESKLRTSKRILKDGTIGDLNLYFSRSYVERSKEMKNKTGSCSRRVKVIPFVEMLIKEIEAHQLESHIL